jgi:hypothetical protein
MNIIYPDSLLRQFVYELEQWVRLLSFLKQENVIYKSRLAEVVSRIDDHESLRQAEKFHDDFLSQDQAIDFLFLELRKHRKLLEKDLHSGGELLNEVQKNQKKLGNDIQRTEEIFSGLKKTFSEFLDSLL